MKKQKLIIPAIIALGASIAANGAYADTASTDFSITVNPSASLTVSAASVNLQITPNKSGVYDSASLDVTASTNSTAGYTLTMATSNTSLTSSTINVNTGTNPTIPSIAESQTGISAADFAASTDSNVLNHWGLAIGNGNFNAIKSEQTIKTTDTNITNDTTTLSMASKLDLNTVPGVYSTTLNFQLTANTPVITLEDSYAAHGKTKATISGNQYYSMQDMSTSICEYANVVPSSLHVYDSRDNTIYTIGKLADNRCWLLDNLALDLTNTEVKNAMYDSSNPSHSTMTNATNEQLGYLFNGGRDINNPATNNLPTVGLTNWASSNSYSTPLINITNKDVLPAQDNGTDEPLASFVTNGKWKVGGYYNYCAASAGSYCYGDDPIGGTSNDRQDTAIDAEYDICPSGWRMPTGGPIGTAGTATEDGGEYQALAKAITDNNSSFSGEPAYSDFRKALRLPLSGYFIGANGASSQGYMGRFWSSTYYSYTMNYMHVPYISKTNIYPQHSYDRNYGLSVRCIAK